MLMYTLTHPRHTPSVSVFVVLEICVYFAYAYMRSITHGSRVCCVSLFCVCVCCFAAAAAAAGWLALAGWLVSLLFVGRRTDAEVDVILGVVGRQREHTHVVFFLG